MKLASLVWGCLLAGFVGQPAWAQNIFGRQEALQWLQRVATASQQLSYSGTFVYRGGGGHSETSRIVHVADKGDQREKIEVLDGSPREVIRRNDEVKCYLPESRLLIVEPRGNRRVFPALLPASLAGLGDSYLIRMGDHARVAGYDSQIVRLEPRDAWRYGHQFWIDQKTGLLIKADMFDARGDTLESLAFTELHIGAPQDPDALKSSFNPAAQQQPWQIRQTHVKDIRDDAPWVFKSDLPGFRRQAAMLRSVVSSKDGAPHDVMHWVFSDGLAALSVFISPLRGSPDAVGLGAQSLGAINVMKRVIDGHLVVVMGDVPPETVKLFADGIGVRGK